MVSLEFNGYCRESKNIPASKGIYLAYACKFNDETHTSGRVTKLLYIGRAIKGDTLRTRVQDHIDGSDPKQNHKNWGHKLTAERYSYDGFVYSYAELDDDDEIALVETALIYANKDKGIYNEKDTKSEGNEDARKLEVKVSGKCTGLSGHKAENK